ncbi:PepSY-associated TM helix domain-containing protein [Tenacibaculum pacificus]|uniref:PepSY-associated TM helix domain-containing protein n=1 Tax=Tenacibaculum pacificus TaxID=3018314 RepID=UPI0022F39015|nr:PepSY-associated TM helix domain-containing protein [Tenacibaculum pacificus]WBX72967.1 PepSY-associated TM helix domain-containing protein [Tenacibaculum pacificus]
MSNRNYNVFFNIHTVSGIVISAALYIIFFAGAFSLFKEEIGIWQEGKAISHTERKNIDYDRILKNIDEKHELTGRDLQINFGKNNDKIYVRLDASKDSLASEKAKLRDYFSVDINSEKTKSYAENYSLGEFLYRLHFFAQLPYIGIYLAGFVSLFFLFAIVTGVIVHWKKIISNFYSFNPKIALKRVWTDAHTALGIIGLPFQFMFAVTGAYFCLSLLVLLPANFLYNGDQNKLMEDLRPISISSDWIEKSNDAMPSFNQFAKQTAKRWDDFHLTRGFIKNYRGTNMKFVINGELKESKRFIGVGSISYDPYSGNIETKKDPNKLSYLEDSQFVLGRLHFGESGGISMKIIYFILALITCFVIITGVLIYIEARNKKSVTLKQRLYTAKVGHIYMAICLSMLPVTALSFLFVKLTNTYFNDKLTAIYSFYFIVWLLIILFFRFKRYNYYINKVSLLFGAIFGFLIPIINGIISGNWIWKTYTQGQFDILLIDVLWIVIATFSLLFYLKIKPKVKEKSAFTKNPIDYKNIEALKLDEANKLQATPKEPNSITTKQTDKNHIEMRTKIIILWLFLGLGWIVHHIYGLFNIYYNETLIMDGATGEAPLIHHIYRILFEGLCLLFALLTIEVSKQWFKWTAFIWAIIAGLYNVYHFVEALLFESSNISEIFMLLLVSLASIFLVRNLFLWKK